MNLKIFYTIIVGIISGILGGAFGLSGTFVMLPCIILLNIVPNLNTAIGTTLFSLLPPAALLAVIEYGKRKEIDYIVGIILFVTYFLAAYIGSYINNISDPKTLEYGCAFTFLLITIYFFYKAYKSKK